MALDAEQLKTAIKVRMTASGFVLENGSAGQFIDILCEEIIAHLSPQILLVYIPGAPPTPTGQFAIFTPEAK